MEWRYVILYGLLLSSCTEKENTNPIKFSDQLVNKWEIVTTDSISSIINRNRNTKVDSFEMKLLYSYCDELYNHIARRTFIDQIKEDTIITNIKFKNFAIIEEKRESKMSYRIILFLKNNSVRFSYRNNLHGSAFMFIKRDTINNHKLKFILKKIKSHQSISGDGVNGEYYNGDVVISIFYKDKIDVYPFLTRNLTNDLYRSYIEVFK